MITLRLGRLEVDWGKNSFFHNHSALFSRDDLAVAEYFYADNQIVEQPAFVRKLRRIVGRLELLGYSLEGCRKAYVTALSHVPDYYPKVTIDFEVFREALCAADLDRVRNDEYADDFDLGELAHYILRDPEFNRVAGALSSAVTRDDGTFFENLDTYVILRLLAENPTNLDRDLVWGIHDVVEEGYAQNGDVYEPLPDESKFLIVTEGSSDSAILKRALPIVAPDVADFFDFLDVKDNYPFTGTGGLVNFCKGLAAMKVQNKVLIILDNDAAGTAAFQELQGLKLARNMRIMKLPYLDELSRFTTLGPSGSSTEDVNGRAVAIECFLDFSFGPEESPTIRWTSYNKQIRAYQGELSSKEKYTKRFFESVNKGGYNLDKLNLLWKQILQACVSEAS
jgi:hypothetical protein